MTEKSMKPTEGFFKIEQFSDGELIDVFEDQNLIMRDSKRTVAYLTSGAYPDGVTDMFIDTFALGTGGTVDGDLLSPKSFDFERPNMFSEAEGKPTYPITWNPKTILPSGDVTVTSEGSVQIPSITNDSTVSINIENDSTIVYVINISNANANGVGDGAIAWTEASLYNAEEYGNYGRNFAMRTFSAKIKENTTNFRITWKIVF